MMLTFSSQAPPFERRSSWVTMAVAVVFMWMSAATQGQPLSPQHHDKKPFANSLYFSFYSDIDVSLHHFLYRWAKMEAMAAGSIPRRYPEPTMREVDRQILTTLSPEKRALWGAAVAHYRQHVVSRSLLFDQGLITLRDSLASGKSSSLAEIDQQTRRQLQQVLTLYGRHWWPRHNREHREWVAAVIGDVIRFERQIVQRITAAYAADWPSPPNRVDLVPYASSTVAYTTGEPHTMIVADDPESRRPWALELLFHEASHSNALEGHLHHLIDTAYQDRDQEPPRNLWHILLFSIAGKATQDVLGEAGRSDYVTMAEQFEIFRRRELDQKIWQVVDQVWYPAMTKGNPLEQVMPAIVDALD